MATSAQQKIFDVKTAVAQRDERRAHRQMQAAEALAPDELRRLQRRRAMELVRFAFDRSPFYRDHYTNAGFAASDLEHDVFDDLPLVNKSDIREQHSRFLARGVRGRDALPSTTGGSTGSPLRVMHDRRSPVAAMWWRTYRWWGVSPADNSAHIHRQTRAGMKEWLDRIQWWPTRQMLLNARGMTDVTMGRFVRELQTLRPALLNGYVDGMMEFAQYIKSTGAFVPAPHAVAVTAAPLLESKRLFMEDVFDAPVYDCYRSAEVPWIAAHCRERDGLHVQADLRILECVDSHDHVQPDGQAGEVVVTDLCNRVFPLIRYRLGDTTAVREGMCPCGMSLPLIESVRGRVADVLRTPSGRIVAGGLSTIFNAAPDAVRQFQIVQETDYSVRVVCVPTSAERWVESAMEDAAAIVRGVLAGEVPVRVDVVRTIPHDGGKIRLVRSKLTSA